MFSFDFDDDRDLDEESAIADSHDDAYWKALEFYYYQNRDSDKDWEQLNSKEIEQVQMDYRDSRSYARDPNGFYCVER